MNAGCWKFPSGGRTRQQLTSTGIVGGEEHGELMLRVKELNELTVQEREEVYAELHGVSEAIEETPELISASLLALDAELSSRPKTRRKALDRALFLKPTLDKDTKFKLMFLRADRYDAGKTAKRMCKYFENKLELFGEEKLVKKITLDDLDEDDMAALLTWCCYFLPHKDKAGRIVWFADAKRYHCKTWENQMRYLWYTTMAALEDEDVQMKGMVCVENYVGTAEAQPKTFIDMLTSGFMEFVTKGVPMLSDLPIRVAGTHCCYDNPKLRPLLSLFEMVAGTEVRLRFRTHYGSELEAQYELLTFGINMAEVSMQSVESYLAERHEKDPEWARMEQEESSPYIPYPKPPDVLLGRGLIFRSHPGNAYLVELMNSHRELYHRSTERLDKTVLSMDVVKRVQDLGGRFLQRTSSGWKQVDDAVANEKIFRSLRRKDMFTKASMQDNLLGGSSAGTTTSTKSNSGKQPEAKRIRY